MKKFLTIILAVCIAAALPASFSGCTARENTLRIYNWGQYMDKSTYKDFEDWYFKQTGEKVKVKYKEFDTNETMLNEIERKGSDYDLVCPSDYMVERMKNKGLLKELDHGTQAIVKAAANQDLVGLMEFDADLKYTMPYIWGTVGIMYNAKAVTDPDTMKSWSVLFPAQNSAMGKKIYMKNSERDSYTVARLYNDSAKLKGLLGEDMDYDNENYQTELKKIFSEIDQSEIDKAKDVLIEQKKFVKSYEVDSAKNDMGLDENGTRGEYGMFWSCDAGYVMTGEEESGWSCGGGSESSANTNLRYVIPDEGSNVWVDCFVIPSNAVNVKAANWFIRYLCYANEQEDVDIGYDCMVYAGGTSAMQSSMDKYYEELNDPEYELFKDKPEFKESYMNMMFPSAETLKRCAIMRDFSEEYTNALRVMWWDKVALA